MIGKIFLSAVDFYDVQTRTTRRKTRPVLVVGGPNENDYTVLPISTITRRENINPYYDVLISPQDRSVLSLNRECFIRTHKQMPMHIAAMLVQIGDMKNDAPDLYIEAIEKMDEFQKGIINNSI